MDIVIQEWVDKGLFGIVVFLHNDTTARQAETLPLGAYFTLMLEITVFGIKQFRNDDCIMG